MSTDIPFATDTTALRELSVPRIDGAVKDVLVLWSGHLYRLSKHGCVSVPVRYVARLNQEDLLFHVHETDRLICVRVEPVYSRWAAAANRVHITHM